MSILSKYGIKEVADVTFYEIGADGKPGKPVLYLNTLKVSTIESTADATYATGGKGNARLIAWDYGKDISVQLTDALFSPKSLSIMMGNGTVKTDGQKSIKKTVERIATTTKTSDGLDLTWEDPNGKIREIASPKVYDAKGTEVSTTSGTLVIGDRYFVVFDQPIESPKEIRIDADAYPGTYYVTGDTFARAEVDGKDQLFQFIIPKAKMSAETSISLEAEGDPSTFDMTLDVLRTDDGQMMKLIQYDLPDA